MRDRKMRRLSVLLLGYLLSSCVTSQEVAQEQRAWCNNGETPPADDWVKLVDFELLTVHPEELPNARRRLAQGTAVQISLAEANRLTRSHLRSPSGQLHLIRGGITLRPGSTIEEVNAKLATADFLEVHWSQSLDAVAVNIITSLTIDALTINSARERPESYDVPLVLRAPAQLRHSYVSCVSTIH